MAFFYNQSMNSEVSALNVKNYFLMFLSAKIQSTIIPKCFFAPFSSLLKKYHEDHIDIKSLSKEAILNDLQVYLSHSIDMAMIAQRFDINMKKIHSDTNNSSNELIDLQMEDEIEGEDTIIKTISIDSLDSPVQEHFVISTDDEANDNNYSEIIDSDDEPVSLATKKIAFKVLSAPSSPQ